MSQNQVGKDLSGAATPALAALSAVSVYLWHPAEQIDGLGALSLSDARAIR